MWNGVVKWLRSMLTSPQPSRGPLRVESLEERVVLDTNNWIAPPLPPGQSASWDLDTNWSLGTHPNAGMDIVFDAAKSNTPCTIPANDAIAPLNSLTFNNWGATLTVNSPVNARTVTINPRTINAGNTEVIINPGGLVHASAALNMLGGSVSGVGPLQAEGTVTFNGTAANDPVQLAAPLFVGTADGTAPGTMTTAVGSLPLQVSGNGQITINNKSSLDFLNQPQQGQQTATAVTNVDNSAHSIYVMSGGVLSHGTTNGIYVGMGVYLWGGKLEVSNATGDPTTLAPAMDFTGTNPAGGGLFTRDNAEVDVDPSAALNFDGGVEVNDNTQVNVKGSAYLTSGVAANSPSFVMYDGTISNSGRIIAHGGFYMLGGTLSTVSCAAEVDVDGGNAFNLEGGTITTGQQVNGVAGQITIGGNFVSSGGSIVIMVDTSNQNLGPFHGEIDVVGNVNIVNNGVTFVSGDVNNGVNVNKDFTLFTLTGTLTGDFTYNLPNGWTKNWDPTNKKLIVHEP